MELANATFNLKLLSFNVCYYCDFPSNTAQFIDNQHCYMHLGYAGYKILIFLRMNLSNFDSINEYIFLQKKYYQVEIV